MGFTRGVSIDWDTRHESKVDFREIRRQESVLAGGNFGERVLSSQMTLLAFEPSYEMEATMVSGESRVTRIGRAGIAAVVLALTGAALFGQAAPPDLEFQVNSFTTEKQEEPVIARMPGDDFIVAWTSRASGGSDTSYHSVQARRFEADGTPLGLDFQVNTVTPAFQGDPDVAIGPGGEFLIVWTSSQSAGSDNNYPSVQARRYAADGLPEDVEFQVNTYITGTQDRPAVAVGDDGSAIVVWESAGSDGDPSLDSVQAQRYAPNGFPDGAQFQVNTYTSSRQHFPDVGLAADGATVVVWSSLGSTGSDQDDSSVQFRRYAPDGSPLGVEVQVNEVGTGRQWLPDVEVAGDGSFLVVWESEVSSGSDTSGNSVQARFYDSGGTPLGGEFQVNTYTSGDQVNPRASRADDGGFVVTWTSAGSYGSDDSSWSIQAQPFSSAGQPLGGQFQVNQVTLLRQNYPDVAVKSDGEFTIVWQSLTSSGTDDDRESIQGRVSPMVTTFYDGFESGDLSAWARVFPLGTH